MDFGLVKGTTQNATVFLGQVFSSVRESNVACMFSLFMKFWSSVGVIDDVSLFSVAYLSDLVLLIL